MTHETSVDVVVVTYNSANHIRQCLEALLDDRGPDLVVVDNASRDGTVNIVEGLGVRCIRQSENTGFAAACNRGWKAGIAPYVLFLNPDAVLDSRSLERLTERLDKSKSVGIAAPRFEYPDGRLAF